MPRPASLAGAAWWTAAIVLLVAGLVHCSGFYHDDAYITLRYADRVLSGHGLTWTGEERIEGFTHPLWLMQLVALGAAGLDLEVASRLLGVSYLLGLVALWAIGRLWPAPLLIVATLPGLLLWAWGGLETTSFCFWMAAGALSAEASRRSVRDGSGGGVAAAALCGAAFAAAALTRPEGLGAGLIAVAWIATARRARPAAVAAIGLLAPVAAYAAFRYAYFGETMPNPARVKISGLPLSFQLSSALHYLFSGIPSLGLRNQPGLWAPGFLAAALAAGLAPAAAAGAVLAMTLPVWASLLLGGGDHMPGMRFMMPIVVLGALAASLAGRPRGWRGRLAAAAIVLAAGAQAWMLFSSTIRRDRAAGEGAPIGRFLETNVPAGALVAVTTAGSTPYHAPSLEFIDMLGLIDGHIARRHIESLTTRWQVMPGHAKGDGAYILSRRPDAVILGGSKGYHGSDPTWWFLSDYELLISEAFRERYRPWAFPIPLTQAEALDLNVMDAAGNIPRDALVLTLWIRNDSPVLDRLAPLGSPLPLP